MRALTFEHARFIDLFIFDFDFYLSTYVFGHFFRHALC